MSTKTLLSLNRGIRWVAAVQPRMNQTSEQGRMAESLTLMNGPVSLKYLP